MSTRIEEMAKAAAALVEFCTTELSTQVDIFGETETAEDRASAIRKTINRINRIAAITDAEWIENGIRSDAELLDAENAPY